MLPLHSGLFSSGGEAEGLGSVLAPAAPAVQHRNDATGAVGGARAPYSHPRKAQLKWLQVLLVLRRTKR